MFKNIKIGFHRCRLFLILELIVFLSKILFNLRIPKPPKLEGFKISSMKKEIKIGNQTIRIQDRDGVDYLSLTDLAKLVNKDTSRVLSNWISMVRTLEFLDIWEKNYNPDYDEEAFQKVRMKAGVPSFFFTKREEKDDKEN